MVRLFNLARGYLLSGWLPSALALAALGGVVLNELVLALPRLTALFIFFVLLNFAGTIAAAIVQAATGRKRRAALSVLAFLATGWIAAQLMIFVIFRGLFDDRPDPFGKNIVIPPGMEVHDPVDHFEEPEGDLPDPFTTQLVAEPARPRATRSLRPSRRCPRGFRPRCASPPTSPNWPSLEAPTARH